MSSISERDNVNPLHNGVYERLTGWLDRERRTIRWLAIAADVPYTTLNSQFQRRSFSLDVVDAAARVLGVSVEWLLRGDVEPAPGGLRPVSGRDLEELRDLVVAALGIVDPEARQLLRDAEEGGNGGETERGVA